MIIDVEVRSLVQAERPMSERESESRGVDCEGAYAPIIQPIERQTSHGTTLGVFMSRGVYS